ncbi:hypothetical protein H0H92_004787 [Tricholoma furcatifolium]|nr:hypothetical protein H0H92_004787 [Tricholoma furcatifolium]
MSSVQSSDVQSAGTAVTTDPHPDSSSDITPKSPSTSNLDSPASGDEQALETHEVIELQSFSERKVWIEEKIKFLEKLPPIEVFAGLDAVRSSAEHVPGVPSREELKQWIVEHDIIEKETEIFDRGELTKLRQLTKAATQRNLSSADTDLIELTLTTIYELDKLLHLLRDRSENLELLATRLTWEESRIAAWVDRRKILEDLQSFLDTRARWSPSIYENITLKGDETPSLQRRGSIASFASASSDTSTNSPGFSRGARFKLAELLSHDAAQFVGRVTSLRHGRIATAGKILDKLIDQSRKPVPEELLDEQDKLEEQGITDMEDVGKFVLDMVIQWRKADEIYVETRKDKAMAQNLFEEIETAKLHHPTARQSASFISRADTLLKRLSFRGNPESSPGSFPCPQHPLFGQQTECNRMLAQLLSSEIVDTTSTARKVDIAAKGYRTMLEAVKRVEDLTAMAMELTEKSVGILECLEHGVPAAEGDGTPPDLSSEACLDANRHAAFLALFPSIVQQVSQNAEHSDRIMRQSVAAMLNLDHPGIDREFVLKARSDLERLEFLRHQIQTTCRNLEGRCDRLKRARSLQSNMNAIAKSLEDMRCMISSQMETQRWRQVTGVPTDNTPLFPRPFDTAHAQVVLGSLMDQDSDVPLRTLCRDLEDPLRAWFLQRSSELNGLFDDASKTVNLLSLVQCQTAAMKAIYEEFTSIQLDIETSKERFEASIQELLDGQLVNGNIPGADIDLQATLKATQANVARFVDSLSDRVLFVAQDHGTTSTRDSTSFDSEFSLHALDSMVRTDSNAFALALSSQVEDLSRLLNHFHLALVAKEVDVILMPTTVRISDLNGALQRAKTALSNASSMTGQDITLPLGALFQDVKKLLQQDNAEVQRTLSSIHDLVQKMDTASETTDSSIREAFVVARRDAFHDATALHKTWERAISSLMDDIQQRQGIEKERLKHIRLAEEQAAKDRIAAEEAERLRAETERLERERLQILEEQRIAEVLRQQAEQERLVAENARLEQARIEFEERQRLDTERLAEERRIQLENARIAAEQADKHRLSGLQRASGAEKTSLERKLFTVEDPQVQAEKDLAHVEEQFSNDDGNPKMAEKAEKLRVQQAVARNDEGIASYHATAGNHPLNVHRTSNGTRTSTVPDPVEFKDFDRTTGREMQKIVKASLDVTLKKKLSPTNEPAIVHDDTLVAEDNDEAPRPRMKLRQDQVGEGKRLPEPHTSSRNVRSAGGSVSPSSSSRTKTQSLVDDDIFILRVNSTPGTPKTKEMHGFQAQVLAFRKRLRTMNINDIARPKKSSAPLPSLEQFKKMAREFSSISSGVSLLPYTIADPSIEAELRSLRTEIDDSAELMKTVERLAQLADDVRKCDGALSDLLEHIDSYPAVPKGIMSSSHTPLLETTPQEQLNARLSFTRGMVETMTSRFSCVSTDSRANAEKMRIMQTWCELEDMGQDKLGGRKSRSGSTISSRPSSGRNSSASILNARPNAKAAAYSNLSASSPAQRLLHPRHPTPRRVVSGGSTDSPSRPMSQLSSLSSSRAVSGPGVTAYGSTIASRQRTTSLSNSHSTPTRPPSVTPRTRAQTTQQHSRVASPTESEISTSRSVRSHTRSSTSMSTWARAPRNSLSSIAPLLNNRSVTPKKKVAMPRKTYIPDPKNKLDVAVGDVVNQLPVSINIEGVSETWKDQSGKYWIGNQDPKLCFCRILRSQTVMVRVGGGWSELSKFIRDHFADSFRILPESPPRFGNPEEKWISSTTLLEAPAEITPPVPPRTPEPTVPFVPAFSLSTPSGQSPRSLHSPSNSPSTKGSPLTPLQFIRRADVDSILRPGTPSKPSTRPRGNMSHTHTATRNSIWRP